MKPDSPPFAKILFVGALLVGWVAVCVTFPDAILGALKTLGTVLLWLVSISVAFGWVIAGLAGTSAGKTHHNPPSPPSASAVSPPPQQRDTFTPFLLGLLIGHWFGSGPDDGDNCQ